MKNITVIGAGTMGNGIAHVFAMKGYNVVLCDINQESLNKALLTISGNLDKKNSDIVFDIFKELAEVYHQSLLIVTHDNDFAKKTHRTIIMEDGKIIDSGL